MNSEKRIKAFSKLGKEIFSLATDEILSRNAEQNPWFVPEFSRYALQSISEMLEEKNLRNWLSGYPDFDIEKPAKKIAVITAGNIPLVGFHDLLCVLVSGNDFVGKISRKDSFLFSKMIDLLIKIEPGFKKKITLTEERPGHFDAIIATGSNNTARYFEYYFKKYPHIIRKNRNSVAVLDGSESEAQLEMLADDVFLYFGLGCRNVSKLYLPVNYDFKKLETPFNKYKKLMDHNKYINNFDYFKSIYLLNGDNCYDFGNLLMKKSEEISSPISVLYYEYYTDICTLANALSGANDQLQCVVTGVEKIQEKTAFGKAQNPDVSEYADRIDSMNFLMNVI